MATPQTTFTIRNELRLCKVHGEVGYFHCWEHFSQPVPAGTTPGSPPAGVVSYVSGIVEFENGVRRVDPVAIHFCDETYAELSMWNKYEKERSQE